MQVDYAFLCDYADTSGNKVNALGIGFDVVYSSQMPFKHRQFYLVVQLRANVTEAGQKQAGIHLIDQDGNSVIPKITGGVNIPKTPGKTYTTGRFIMGFGNVQFKNYGSYSVRFTMQGIEQVNIPFEVRKREETKTDQGSGQ